MGFFDDLGLSEFFDDVRAAGEEFEALKDEVISSVTDLGRELSGDAAPAEPEEKADQQ